MSSVICTKAHSHCEHDDSIAEKAMKFEGPPQQQLANWKGLCSIYHIHSIPLPAGLRRSCTLITSCPSNNTTFAIQLLTVLNSLDTRWSTMRYGGWRPRGVGAWWSLRSLPTQAILWFCDSLTLKLSAFTEFWSYYFCEEVHWLWYFCSRTLKYWSTLTVKHCNLADTSLTK